MYPVKYICKIHVRIFCINLSLFELNICEKLNQKLDQLRKYNNIYSLNQSFDAITRFCKSDNLFVLKIEQIEDSHT